VTTHFYIMYTILTYLLKHYWESGYLFLFK